MQEFEEEDPMTESTKKPIIRSALDLQRLKIEKLMKNPEKPVIIPEPPKEKDYLQSVPNFVRNVMGSSAGAGSGEFHVYRHLRRKEYARQKQLKTQSVKEQLDQAYQEKLERNQRQAEEKTAKKRAKRLKKKKQLNQKGKKPKISNEDDELKYNFSEESDVEEKSDEVAQPSENPINKTEESTDEVAQPSENTINKTEETNELEDKESNSLEKAQPNETPINKTEETNELEDKESNSLKKERNDLKIEITEKIINVSEVL